jgi:trk system potassium uptake protein TrkA
LADQLTWTNVLDVLAIDSEFSFMETAVPTSMIGQSLQEADIRRRFGVWVVGLRDALTQKLRMFPEANYVFTDDHAILLLGKTTDLEKFRNLE